MTNNKIFCQILLAWMYCTRKRTWMVHGLSIFVNHAASMHEPTQISMIVLLYTNVLELLDHCVTINYVWRYWNIFIVLNDKRAQYRHRAKWYANLYNETTTQESCNHIITNQTTGREHDACVKLYVTQSHADE